PHERADAAGDQPDDKLRDTKPCVAEVDAADANEPNQAQQLKQTPDYLRFVGERLAGQGMAAIRRSRIHVCLRVLPRRRVPARWRLVTRLLRGWRIGVSALTATELRLGHGTQHARVWFSS